MSGMSGEPFAEGSRASPPRSSDMHELAAWTMAAVALVWVLAWMAVGMAVGTVGTVLRGGK